MEKREEEVQGRGMWSIGRNEKKEQRNKREKGEEEKREDKQEET